MIKFISKLIFYDLNRSFCLFEPVQSFASITFIPNVSILAKQKTTNQNSIAMKSKILSLIILLGIFSTFNSCEKDDASDPLGGTPSAIGSVNNTFQLSGIPSGTSGVSAKVTNLSEGVSTVTYTATITNSSYLTMISSMTDVNISGSTVQREGNYRITSEGMESVYPEGNLTLVKYNAKVGDVYSLKRGSTTLMREVTSVSTDDDYNWGGMLIKTIQVKETGRNIPGVSNIDFVFNHKFGIVGFKISFEDGTSKTIGVSSANQN
jgi:hypothetical protein